MIMRLIYGSKLKTGASWIWLIFGVGFLTLTFWPGLIDVSMKLVKVDSWIEIVFFFILISLLTITMHFSIVIANLADRSKDLAQEVAFLNREIEDMKKDKTLTSTDNYN
jgi:hypothetical protein